MADQPKLLTMASDELCASCHDTDDSGFAAAHQNYPVKSRCIDCHAQHSSNDPKMLKEVVHPPVRSGDCNDCHQVEGDAVKLQSSEGSICLNCHDDVPEAAQHAPVSAGECRECHAPHASEHEGMLAEAPTRVCLKCHDFGE
jgi:predicted CXXCH cytochrome family protein